MAKHWSKYLHERIAQNERTIKSLSSMAREAEKNLSAVRKMFKSEQLRREQSERALYDAKPKLIRLSLENQQLRAQFIEQTKLQDALAEANSKIKKLEKELNRRSGLEDPYGLATPSSKRVTKTNSTLENRAKRGGAGLGHKGYGRKKFSAEEADIQIHLDLVPPSCECGGTWLKGGTVPHSVYHYIPAKIEKHIYYKNICVCSHCEVKAVGKTPGVMPNSLFSNSMIAHLLAEHYYHGATAGSLEQRCNINHGTFFSIAQRTAMLLKPSFEKIIEQLRLCLILHADETGWMMDGKKAYAWLFANDDFKVFLFRETRGSVVPKEVFGEEFLQLILVTDRYCGYSPLALLHQYCYVHLMRDVKSLEVEFPDDLEIATFVSDLNPLLAEAIGLRNKGLSLKDYRKTAKEIKKKIMDICESQANHPGIQHIQNIFRAHPTRLFQWLKSPKIPADNNFAISLFLENPQLLRIPA